MWVPKRDYSSREQRQIRKKPKNTRANIWDIALANTLKRCVLVWAKFGGATVAVLGCYMDYNFR